VNKHHLATRLATLHPCTNSSTRKHLETLYKPTINYNNKPTHPTSHTIIHLPAQPTMSALKFKLLCGTPTDEETSTSTSTYLPPSPHTPANPPTTTAPTLTLTPTNPPRKQTNPPQSKNHTFNLHSARAPCIAYWTSTCPSTTTSNPQSQPTPCPYSHTRYPPYFNNKPHERRAAVLRNTQNTQNSNLTATHTHNKTEKQGVAAVGQGQGEQVRIGQLLEAREREIELLRRRLREEERLVRDLTGYLRVTWGFLERLRR
ncbi:hypothetical protein EJ05DRAFT_523014, partial [Pseudovirgaria hyperparasitica]